ncbi:hypothetical protein PV327_008290 [Microctonus hyperodae]|uniref:Uncharacterized protein n=1 Tax=Microctonus hyperodae TaxID=165561 RepID=A0AA39F2U7_MICHY|nr:hypothetical protein PV327_008290 [Microctonus hyperodae]
MAFETRNEKICDNSSYRSPFIWRPSLGSLAETTKHGILHHHKPCETQSHNPPTQTHVQLCEVEWPARFHLYMHPYYQDQKC